MSDSTKGVWHRPGDRKRFSDNYDIWQANLEKERQLAAKYIPVRKQKKQAAQG